jgi:hypothetical protein
MTPLFFALDWLVRGDHLFRYPPVRARFYVGEAECWAAEIGIGFRSIPLPLLSAVLTLEAALLTSFVLIRQSAINLQSERRNLLDSEDQRLAEEEATESCSVSARSVWMSAPIIRRRARNWQSKRRLKASRET